MTTKELSKVTLLVVVLVCGALVNSTLTAHHILCTTFLVELVLCLIGMLNPEYS